MAVALSVAVSSLVAVSCVLLAWWLGRRESAAAHKLALFSATLGVAKDLMDATFDAVDQAQTVAETHAEQRLSAIVVYAASARRFKSAVLVAFPFLPRAVTEPALRLREGLHSFGDGLEVVFPSVPAPGEQARIDELVTAATAVNLAMQAWFRALVPEGGLGPGVGDRISVQAGGAES